MALYVRWGAIIAIQAHLDAFILEEAIQGGFGTDSLFRELLPHVNVDQHLQLAGWPGIAEERLTRGVSAEELDGVLALST
ncbi:hypothetical protein JNB62_06445 [Microbacterium jejuense]|uniref:Uncharacterized protein n=1 Tax=Microbacterium jejuense TaxID=1263637 RepID=A0ABS7HK44_9MICO|nr:hypothetical protein [Microbacterium jejuense]MBW9093316.1 hypothetical protein [Microbacterium jejuense]